MSELLSILIVEDSEDDALLLLRELKRGGYQVRYRCVQTAEDFGSALDQDQWQMIIADYRMPNFSGLDALRMVKSRHLDIPFLVLSGTLSEEAAVETLRTGASDFFVKGNTARLLPAIERELREAEERTKRRQAENNYEYTKTRLQMAVDASRMTVWQWDIATNRVLYGDVDGRADYYEELFGLAWDNNFHNEIDLFFQRVYPEDVERLKAAINANLTQDTPYRVEFRVIWQDGSIHWLLTQGCTIRDDDGKPLYMTGVMQNITEHKQLQLLEHEQLRLKATLEKELELTNFRNRFMAMAAHEFRTPLTVISSANEILYEYYDQMPPEKHKEYLLEIRTKVKHLREMLTEIETVTREDASRLEFAPQITDVVEICEQVIEELQIVHHRTHPVHLLLRTDQRQYRLDGRLFGQIVSNLLSNAIKFSKRGTRIEIQLAQEDQQLVLKVSDQGFGILPEDLPNIFDLFFRGSNIGGITGRGVGLKQVRDYVDVHHGQIEVDTTAGRGSTFTVRLPVE